MYIDLCVRMDARTLMCVHTRTHSIVVLQNMFQLLCHPLVQVIRTVLINRRQVRNQNVLVDNNV